MSEQDRFFTRLIRVAFAASAVALCLAFALPATAQSSDRTESQKTVWDESFIEAQSKELRTELDAFLEKAGFSSKTRVKRSERFLFVYDVSDGYVEWISALLNEVAKAFDKFVEKIGLEVDELSEPMVVVIFATREEFDAYAVELRGPAYLAQENKPTGFYTQRLNRSIIYDRTGVESTRSDLDALPDENRQYSRKRINEEAHAIKQRDFADANTSTIVHEATHQIAFNRGVFLRTGPVALWTAEGLSLVFETPNGHATQGGWGFRGSFPKNTRMINLFREKIDSMEDPFRTIVAQEKFYQNLEGSYAASWALFYYLYKKNPAALSKYMRHIAEKSPCTVYPAQERLKDFEEFFGDDWEKLDSAVKRYVKRL